VNGPSGDDNGDGLDDRSGFSVIVISQDLEGIELAFWEDRIWAQEDDSATASDLFTQAEGIAFDTTAQLMRYELDVSGNRYQLFADEDPTPILTGSLRNYANFSGSLDPYETPSFLFLGDDSTRGESRVDIANISIGTFEFILGDMDCDRDVDFDDIDDFALGLNDPLAYEQLFGIAPAQKGDTDGDSDLDFDDITGFVDILNGQGVAASHLAIPEPSCQGLLLFGAVAYAIGCMLAETPFTTVINKRRGKSSLVKDTEIGLRALVDELPALRELVAAGAMGAGWEGSHGGDKLARSGPGAIATRRA
jgi:hypothetical protein